MTYRVLMRPTRDGYDAWVPEFPGLATVGSTEEEAVKNIQKAIKGRLDLEIEPAEMSTPIETSVDVPMKTKRENPKAGRLEELPGPILIPGLPQIYLGLGVFVLGLVGVAFYFMIEPQSSPPLLFLPFGVLALGALGLFFGAISLDAAKHSNRR